MIFSTTASRRMMGFALVVGFAGAANAQLFTGASTLFVGVTGLTVQYSTNGGGSYSGSTGAGFMRWRPNNGIASTNLANYGGRSDGDFNALCGELVGLASPQMVDGYASNDGSLSADVKRAGAVAADHFFAVLGLNDLLQYSALQAAVWAGRYGGDSGIVDNGATIDVGAFSIRNAGGVGGGNWATFKGSMASYYTASKTAGWSGISVYLDASPLGGSQDQFTMENPRPPVPEPFTMALGAASLALAARRRLSKKA